MNRKHLIYVENISPSSTEEQLLTYLEKWGPVQQVYFLREKQCTKRSIAAFVRVACQEDLEHVMSRNQQNYRGKRLFMVAADQPQFFQADLSVIVRNITGKISEENLFDHFEDCGKITFLQIRTDDFAYICFQDKAGVRNAMAKNNLQLKTAHLKIQLLTRNVEVMIVNLETLPNRMPDLYRKMCLPVEPRTPGQQSNQKPNQQQKEEPPKAALPEPNQQQQSQQQQQNNRSNQQQQNNRSNQQQQNNRSNQQHQNNRSNQQQQNNRSNQQQQQQEQQRSNQPQPQPQQQQQQRSNQPQQQQQRSNQQQQQQQRTNQSQQQQQQKLNQPQPQQQQRSNQPQPQQQQKSNQPQPQQQQKSNQPQPQQQQQQQRLNQQQRPNQQQKQVEQQQQRPQVPQQPPQPQRQTQLNWFMRQQKPEQQAQQQKAQSTVQILKEKANAIAAQKQQELPPVRSPAAEVTNSSPNNATSLANGQHEQPKATPTPNQQIEEIVIIDDLDPDVPESSPIPPIPSKYQPKPDDLMPPIKASELRMRNINGHNVRAVWINNIDQEVSGLDLIRYLEQFGDVEYFRFGYAQNSLFTKWAKVIFAEQESAVAACEYFLHPYNGRYLFVLSCTRSIEENPERTFFVDYLSRYIVYEDIVKAFKHIGNVFYYARVINSLRKIRIFFTTDVDVEAVLAVDKISGLPVRLERFSRNTNDKISRGQYKRIKSGRNVIPPHHKPRVSAANRSRKQELDELFSYHKDSVNPEDKKHVIGVMITNISKKTTDQEILDLFKEVGEPLAYRRQPEPHDSSERVFIQYNTLSKVWHAVKLRPAVNSFDGYTVFMYDPQRRPKMSSHDTIVLSLENPLSIQDVYNGTLEFGPIRLIEKLNSRVVKVCFKPKPDTMSKVRHIETICSVNVVKAVLYREKKHKIDGPIVIDDDDDEEEEEGIVDVTSENHVVYAVEDDNPYADAEKSETQEQQKPVQQEQQKQQQQQQTQKNQGQQKQQSSTAQQNQDKKVRNPFSGGNQLNRQNRRRPPPPRRRNVAPRGNFRNDEPMHPFERSNPSMRHELFDDRFAQIDRFEQERRMQQMFDQELPPQFSRDFDDPRQYRSRSPHHQGRVSPWQRGPSGFHGDDAGWGGDSRGIPSNIPEQDLDEYISRKQEAIQRRLEQLERQLVTSVESSREMEQYEYAAGRRQGTFFSDNGDVHYVPNPAARQQRGGGMGRNSRNARNQKRAESYRQKRAENHRTRDPFSGLDIAPIIRVPDDHSPPPKRNRGNAEEDFDTDRFNAAWN